MSGGSWVGERRKGLSKGAREARALGGSSSNFVFFHSDGRG